jgi:hypothetical protein
VSQKTQNDENLENFLKEEKKEKKEKKSQNSANKGSLDPYTNPIRDFFNETVKEVYGQNKLLSASSCDKILELNSLYPDFKPTLKNTLKFLKKLKFKDIDFKPSVDWLLKDDNYVKVRNGAWGSVEKMDNSTTEAEITERKRLARERVLKLRPDLAKLGF